jgi:hypothetical protein
VPVLFLTDGFIPRPFQVCPKTAAFLLCNILILSGNSGIVSIIPYLQYLSGSQETGVEQTVTGAQLSVMLALLQEQNPSGISSLS